MDGAGGIDTFMGQDGKCFPPEKTAGRDQNGRRDNGTGRVAVLQKRTGQYGKSRPVVHGICPVKKSCPVPSRFR